MENLNIDQRTVNVSCLIMAAITAVGMLMVAIAANPTGFGAPFRGHIEAIVVIVLVAMASHNVMRGLREIGKTNQ